MNCELCRENLDAYREGNLLQDMRILVEDHLNMCKDCAEILSLINLTEKIILIERRQEPNPFLSTRVMASIDTAGTDLIHSTPVFIRAIRPFAVLVSLAAVIFIGIIVGNLAKSASDSSPLPVELVLMNDSDIEAISLLSSE